MEGSREYKYYLGVDVFGRVARRYDIYENDGKTLKFVSGTVKMSYDKTFDTLTSKLEYEKAVELYTWIEVPSAVFYHFCLDGCDESA